MTIVEQYIKALEHGTPSIELTMAYRKFKCGGKTKKKEEGGEIEEAKCGCKTKKKVTKAEEGSKVPKKYPLYTLGKNGKRKVTYYDDEATRDSLAVNMGDSETGFNMPGSYVTKNGKSIWVPDRTKYPYNRKNK